METTRHIHLTVNGRVYERTAPVRMTLADFLREELNLTGTHLGCEHGVCGACTILYNGEAVRSCLMLAVQADGAELMTVEGLAQGDTLHPLQQAFPGVPCPAMRFLHPRFSHDGLRLVAGNAACRCTGYAPSAEAVAKADMCDAKRHVRFTPDCDRKSRHRLTGRMLLKATLILSAHREFARRPAFAWSH